MILFGKRRREGEKEKEKEKEKIKRKRKRKRKKKSLCCDVKVISARNHTDLTVTS